MDSMSHYAGDLTLLYTETKKKALSSIGRKEAAPALPHLDRKLRIQKDRLITWGLEWTDQGDQDKGSGGDIDESVARAGVTETVTSVLGNIQEVLEQAETIKISISTWSAPEKASLSASDEAKYQDLLKDLESSIDILYEISRSRRALATGSHPTFSSDQYAHEYAPGTIVDTSYLAHAPRHHSHPTALPAKQFGTKTPYQSMSYASSQTTLINPPSFSRPNLSPYAALPISLDPQALKLPAEAPPPYETFGVPSAARMIGRLIKSRAPESVQAVLSSSSAEAYVLVEYANYDPLYHETGVPPPLQRLEGLAAALHQAQAKQQRSLILLGYFEDPQQPRIGLVYDFLGAVHGGLASLDLELDQLFPVSLLNLLQTANKGLKPADIANATPFLEDRFRVALRVASNLKDLHSEGYAHGSLNSGSVIFFRQGKNPHLRRGELHRPTLSAFDMFPKTRNERGGPAPSIDISKHPQDNDRSFDNVKAIKFDLYGLALILLEIGLWIPLHDLYKAKYSLKDFKLRIEKIWVPRLASKCGSLYMRAVQACLRLSDDTELGKIDIGSMYEGILRRLQRCCFLDEDEPIWPRSDTFSAPSQSATWQDVTHASNVRRNVPFEGPGSLGPPSSGRHTSQLPGSAIASDGMPHSPSIVAASDSVRKPRERHDAHSGGLSSRHLDDRSRSYSSIPTTLASTARETPMLGPDKTHTSFRDYRQKVMLIQACWRNRCRRKAAASRESSDAPPQVETSLANTVMHTHHHQHNLHTARSSPRRSDGSKRHSQKRQIIPLKPSDPAVLEWNSVVSRRIARIVERALKDSLESCSIDLLNLGEEHCTTKPTILVSCTSTARVRAALKRKFDYDRSLFDLKVRRGEIRLAKGLAKERLAKQAGGTDDDDIESDDVAPLNPYYQQRPVCGASIGAYLPDHGHLDPVSYGGVIMVEKDGHTQSYGMSVHHMLEPSDRAGMDNRQPPGDVSNSVSRSSSRSSVDHSDHSDLSEYTNSDGDISSEFDSDVSEDEDTAISEMLPVSFEYGDKPGVQPQDHEAITVTQPAFLDACAQNLHADDAPLEELDEDHLDSYKLGKIYASSGLRRTIVDGIRLEIDWALIELAPSRLQPYNLVKGGRKYCARKDVLRPRLVLPLGRQADAYTEEDDLYPVGIVPENQLANLNVHCFGRTSGLQCGLVSAGQTMVKIRGRRDFSHSWTLFAQFGIGGDSGAWVIDNDSGRVCGHILAEGNGRTYICSMQILFDDMKKSLGATRITLPGGTKREDTVKDDTAVVTEQFGADGVRLGLTEKGARRSRYEPGRAPTKKHVECGKVSKCSQPPTVLA